MKLPSEETIIKRLSSFYGLPFPKAFAPLVEIALEAVTRHQYIDESRFMGYYGFRFSFDSAVLSALPKSALERMKPSRAGRYPQSPPEYFVFGWLGADGVSYGYLVHAPELGCEDYPIVEEQPMVNEGLVLFGKNTAEGLQGIFSQEMAYWEKNAYKANSEYRPQWEAVIQQVTERYGIAPSAEKAPDYKARYTPPVPDGWHFEPSRDGVGVLAPKQFFASYPTVIAKWKEAPEPVFAFAREALAQGYPASALLSLRETFYNQWSAQNKAELKTLFSLWEQCYIALDRPLFAKIVKHMAKL